MSCNDPLKPKHLVPILSWLLLRGRCSSCESKVSIQYPLVEFLTGALFAVASLVYFSLVVEFLVLVLLSLWVLIGVYDVRHTIIPDSWAYMAAGVAILITAILSPHTLSDIWFWSAGIIVAAPLAFLWSVSGGKAMGLGDAKLALSIGWLLGPWFGFLALMWGFIIGALWALVVLLPQQWLYTVPAFRSLRKRVPRFTMKSEVPFGPFLIAGALFVWLVLSLHLPFPLLIVS